MTYQKTYDRASTDPEGFWMEAAGDIDWMVPPTRAFEPNSGVYGRWFEGAVGNTCYNAVDRHVAAGRGDQPAIIYDSPVTDTKRTLTFAELQDEVATLGAVLHDMGVGQGDRVIIYMPMVAEALVAMLACARIGAVHSVVFGGFAAAELATRIDDAGASAVLTASCGVEPGRVINYMSLLSEAIDIADNKIAKCLVLQRDIQPCELTENRDLDWAEEMARARAEGRRADCAEVAATDPAYILYTSGTTGQPKGVVRDTGGHMVALNWSMKNIYGANPGEVFWAASDVGWVVGHSYICYAPLLAGCTTVVFEGKPIGTPDAGTFWRVIAEHDVSVMFTAPTAFRAIRGQDPEGEFVRKYDISCLRALFLAGERSDPTTLEWAEAQLGVPVIDHWWQTETGWAISAIPMGIEPLPVKHGSPGVPMPGYDVQVLDDAGHPVPNGTLGNIVVKLPLPPSCLTTLWNAEERFHSSYLNEFPGYYATSDAGILDEEGYLHIMARTDDIINVAGHRLSTGAMEEVLAGHDAVAECAVVGKADALKGQVPLGFFVLKSGVTQDAEEVAAELVQKVRQDIGAVAAFKLAVAVKRLPKTRSGKVLRATMQKIADDESYKMPAAIDDPAILDEITKVLTDKGLIG
ncbi:propionyl-CoA synthetase [Gymnodinialimonas ceratoperidinii]|uniref:Propionyl-CoA synthetase n=1 Tax=Gymnodinialimonas ceratoperidinii TaxID=2856823 RepID=A0A8F6TV93_9RHOB|nr:propionyl-CoA synthetase [Gymnodinialimonas ceratoperidinii]QXT38357.1 propionyl-CoA synthetase [Gymnodinialimonas ceratoperidinii]